MALVELEGLTWTVPAHLQKFGKKVIRTVCYRGVIMMVDLMMFLLFGIMLGQTSDNLLILNSILGFLTVLLAPWSVYLLARLRAKDAEITKHKSLKNSALSIASEAVSSNKEMANYVLAKDGKSPLPVVAAVIAEADSPSTELQRQEAMIATMRADMAAMKLAVGQSPRSEPLHATAAEEQAKQS